MGLMVDTNVFIKFEKRNSPIVLPSLAESDEAFISAITVSELLVGVHRANTEERRQRRAAFVEAILRVFPVLNFTMSIARTHAEIQAHLAKAGLTIGHHDLIIAATARHYDHALHTDNTEEFSRVPGLRVIPFTA